MTDVKATKGLENVRRLTLSDDAGGVVAECDVVAGTTAQLGAVEFVLGREDDASCPYAMQGQVYRMTDRHVYVSCGGLLCRASAALVSDVHLDDTLFVGLKNLT